MCVDPRIRFVAKMDLYGGWALTIPKMPCPVCRYTIESGADHRRCVFKLLDENKIQTAEEWEIMCKPKTIRKGRVRALIPKEEKE